ncbi:MAG: Histidinol dehydrogenase [Methanosarcinales archeaon 56_1174]|uniref:histidinol dehydrogenase n=1 Tax=Methermicoccus shengliensis TaxID=660064 RepID=UPI00069423D2|nr:histidinol dehydrogenase [Methermicoccus shengliensis]KUK30268.1 MAG: Histidinol dehydrogenase [Methanosarcinales archeaon 56_1174]
MSLEVVHLKSLGSEERRALLERSSSLTEVVPTVRAIIEDVRERGDAALIELTERFDGTSLSEIRVSRDEMERALERVEPEVLDALRTAAKNIERFHALQLEGSEWMHELFPGVRVGVRYTPIESVGAYVPGGRAAYPSTVLMCCIPAKVAGVDRICMCTPPTKSGEVNPYTLAAAHIAGVREVYKVGGAQAIAAMAYGTESIAPVHKIVGPGNVWVTCAKMLVRDVVDIDFPAGPSEVLVIADESADATAIALDLLAQAEHDPSAVCVLITPSERLALEVSERVDELCREEPRSAIIEQALSHARAIVASSIEECIAFSNEFAPEHLEIMTEDPEAVLKHIRSAGSIFLGRYTPVAVGDYASGTNHVLPTAGYARMYSALGTHHFMKLSCVQHLTREGLKAVSDVVCTLARVEGLYAHAHSVERRVER